MANKQADRRQFLKSLLGLGSTSKHRQQEAACQASFVWADLRTGQIGFPTGTDVPRALPGSLMGLIAAAAIKQENLLPEDFRFQCSGSIIVGGRSYSCQTAHGQSDLIQAVARSCNVFFAGACRSLNLPVLLGYASKFALDQSVAGTASGAFPETANGCLQEYMLGLSEDLKPNILQILQVSALIATRGNPPVLYSAHNPDPSFTAAALDLDHSTWDILQQAMQMAGHDGAARILDPDNKLNASVKIGFAPHGAMFSSWLTGYFPAHLPRYAFCAHVGSGGSALASVPLARRFLFSTEWP